MLFVYFLYQTSEVFLNTYVKNSSDLYVPFVFDAMWTIALTLNNSMHEIKTTLNKSLADFTHKDSSMVQTLKKTLENVNFQGITVKKFPEKLCLTALARETRFPPKNIPISKKLISDESFIIALIFNNASLLLDYLISTQNVTIFYRGK